jgi:hypothetical protein
MRHTIEMWVGDQRLEVDGEVRPSEDGSEYVVELVEVRCEGRVYPPCFVFTPEQEEDARDRLAEVERERERAAGTLPYSLEVV